MEKYDYSKHKKDLTNLANEYLKADHYLGQIEKELARLRNLKDQASHNIVSLKSQENELINKIEEESGEKVTPDILMSIIKD